MNVILWMLQVLLGLAFIAGGMSKALQYEQAKRRMAWVGALPRSLVAFIGIVETLGGIGLILPALTGVASWLTPLAAAGLALVMVLAAVFHARRKEYNAVPVNVVLFALAAFVTVGRWVIAPFS